MLSRLFQQLFASFGVAFRTVRAFFARTLNGMVARIKSATSLTRQAAKLAPAMMKTVATAGKKPTKREDYIETRQMFISKSFLIMALVVVIALAALFYWIGWPWLVSRFFTAKMWYEDPDVADYSGEVILYYEKEKETVRFEGRLEEGVIQGEGKIFDENGMLVYSGSYVDGIYNGMGTLYIDGALTYEGAFADGLYNGKGKLYGPEEQLLYEGGFAAGVRSGEGTAYENGRKCYRGAFENDLYNGEGVLYNDNGKILYEGIFLDGLYDGDGILSLESGVTVEAAFQGGEVLGTARYLRNGKLYYEGDTVDLLPEGVGTLYGGNGRALYTGPMRTGTIDGSGLLGLPAEELRSMLQATLTETTGDRGFSITDEKLGFTAFCSYAQDGAEPAVYYVYLYGGSAISGLLWETAADFEAYALAGENVPDLEVDGAMAAVFPAQVPVELGETPYCRSYQYDGYTLQLWSKEKNAAPLLAEWRLDQDMPEPSQEASASEGSVGRLEALLAQLGLPQPNGGTGGETTGNPYYGQLDAAQLLSAAEIDERTAVLTAALTYFEYAERRAIAEENLALCQILLEEERKLADQGKGDALRISQLEDRLSRLEVEIMKHVVQMRKDARAVESATGLAVQDFDLQALAMLFDVTKLDAAALGEEAVAVAMEAALAAVEPVGGESAAGDTDIFAGGAADRDTEGSGDEEPPDSGTANEETADGGEEAAGETQVLDIEPVDRAAVLRLVEDSLLELELAYQDVMLALREYETASETAAQAQQDYAMGVISNTQRIESQMAANELRSALYTTTADFARRAAALNEITGGRLAAEINWMPDVLGN